MAGTAPNACDFDGLKLHDARQDHRSTQIEVWSLLALARRSRPDPTADPLGVELAALRETIASLHKPAGLRHAEQQLIAARQRRTALHEELRQAIPTAQDGPNRRSGGEAEVQRLQAEIEKLDTTIGTLRGELRIRRTDFAPDFAAAIAPHRRAAAAAILDAISTIEHAAAVLVEADHAAAREGIELPAAMPPMASMAIADLRRVMPTFARLAGRQR
jgi:hypothetical protein